MERVWEDLRRQREQRGLSLRWLAEQTKVAERHLLALEQGRLADLPHGIFRRGIIRSYLQALDLSSGSWMERFDACLLELSPSSPAPEELATFAEGVWRNRTAEAPRREAWRWPGVLAMLVALLLFGWCVWRYALRGRLVLSTAGRDGAAIARRMGGGPV